MNTKFLIFFLGMASLPSLYAQEVEVNSINAAINDENITSKEVKKVIMNNLNVINSIETSTKQDPLLSALSLFAADEVRQKRRQDIIENLLAMSIDIYKNHFMKALELRDINSMQLMLKKQKVDGSLKDNKLLASFDPEASILMEAVLRLDENKDDQKEIFREFLEQSNRNQINFVNFFGKTAICNAIQRFLNYKKNQVNRQFIEMLLDRGADPNRGVTLLYAIAAGDDIYNLIYHSIKPNTETKVKDKSLLMMLLGTNLPKKIVFDKLIDLGVSYDDLDTEENTILHYAAKLSSTKDNIAINKNILEKKPEFLNKKNKEGKTPFNQALWTYQFNGETGIGIINLYFDYNPDIESSKKYIVEKEYLGVELLKILDTLTSLGKDGRKLKENEELEPHESQLQEKAEEDRKFRLAQEEANRRAEEERKFEEARRLEEEAQRKEEERLRLFQKPVYTTAQLEKMLNDLSVDLMAVRSRVV